MNELYLDLFDKCRIFIYIVVCLNCTFVEFCTAVQNLQRGFYFGNIEQ